MTGCLRQKVGATDVDDRLQVQHVDAAGQPVDDGHVRPDLHQLSNRSPAFWRTRVEPVRKGLNPSPGV